MSRILRAIKRWMCAPVCSCDGFYGMLGPECPEHRPRYPTETGLYWVRPRGQAEPWQPAWVSIGRGLVARFSDEDLAYYEWLRIEAPPADPLNTP